MHVYYMCVCVCVYYMYIDCMRINIMCIFIRHTYLHSLQTPAAKRKRTAPALEEVSKEEVDSCYI